MVDTLVEHHRNGAQKPTHPTLSLRLVCMYWLTHETKHKTNVT